MRWPVIALAALLTVFCGYYSARNFSINTDVNKLISRDLDWRKRELAVDTAFPHRHETILAVVEAPTSELATQATAELIERLVHRQTDDLRCGPRAGRRALLQQERPAVRLDRTGRGLHAPNSPKRRPLIQVLVSDQNWRGLVQALTFALAGLQRNMYTLDAMTRPLTMFASTIEDAIAGRPASFSWRELVARKTPEPSDLRRIIEIRPILDLRRARAGRGCDQGDPAGGRRPQARHRISRAACG